MTAALTAGDETTSAVVTGIRDLSESDFARRYECDRFTASVLGNRMRYICQHMATGLMQQAFSPIISQVYDFATAIVGPPETDYVMPAVSNGLALFLGTLSDAVRNTVEEYGIDRLCPGDVLTGNDPYRLGGHVNDLVLISPLFHDDRLTAFVLVRAHQLDMGGVVPGGFGASKRTTHENGLVIPPTLLYSQGQPVRSTFSLILDNVRMGEMLLPDIKTIERSCRLGGGMMSESLARYGRDAVLGAMRFCGDRSAESLAAALQKVPDGDYTGRTLIDADAAGDDEQYDVVVTVRIRGARAEVDLSGSSRQARTCINATALDAKTAIGAGLHMLLALDVPFTSGSFRGIDVIVPPGCISGALPPEGAVLFYWEVSSALLAALIIALREPLGADAFGGDFGSTATHNAMGTHADGSRWGSMTELGGEWGAWGASRAGDGDAYNTLYFVNTLAASTESIESSVPAVLMHKEYIADTSGPGQHRGGSGMLKDVRYLQDAEHYTTHLRLKEPSGVGVHGGLPGRVGGVWIFDQQGSGDCEGPSLVPAAYAEAAAVAGVLDPVSNVPSTDGAYNYYGRQSIWTTKAGATFRYWTNGGGGWGDPLERDPVRVARDVRDGYVSIEGAARDYGVVVVGDADYDPEQVHADETATAGLRAQMRTG